MRALRLVGFLFLLACASAPRSPEPDAGVPDSGGTTDDAALVEPDAYLESDAGHDDAGPLDAGMLPRARVRFALDEVATDFFAFPFPSDLRLDANERPEASGYPNPRNNAIIAPVIPLLSDRQRFPVIPVAYFRFTAPIAAISVNDPIAAEASASILLLDIDPGSAARGTLMPVVAQALPRDAFTGDHLLAIGVRPGVVLHPDRTYAFVVRRALGDANGSPLEVDPVLSMLASGGTPPTAWGARARDTYAPLWQTLAMIGVPAGEVAAATVMTTGDVVRDLAALSEQVRADFDVTIEGLALDPDDGVHDRYCELLGTVSMPQFQRGSPPFPTEGLFELDPSGDPIEQRRETVPVVITIPRREMPDGGWPLVYYVHGSGGRASQVVDRGPYAEDLVWTAGEGPAHVLADLGLAAFGAAMPVSPDRLPGAGETAYLNFVNLAAFRDTFRQGAIEQRLLLDALLALEIDPSILASCSGATLPSGQTHHRFDGSGVGALGQSMGAMYLNLLGPIEPRFTALVPTGAGGYWGYFILDTELIGNPRQLLGLSFGVNGATLSQLHPILAALELAWESAEPMVYMPRISRRPLPGIAPRPIFQPAARGDHYFPIHVYDAVALAYGHQLYGAELWPSMQETLAVQGLAGLGTYPGEDNRTSENGVSYTSVTAQYDGLAFGDPHDNFMQLPELRHQWGCFLASALVGGRGIVPAPAPPGSGCM